MLQDTLTLNMILSALANPWTSFSQQLLRFQTQKGINTNVQLIVLLILSVYLVFPGHIVSISDQL